LSKIITIALGAALGANARYWLGEWSALRFGNSFPYGTLLVNVMGSFFLGLIVSLLIQWGANSSLTPSVRLFLAVGFLGSFTTFSSFSVETLLLLEQGRLILALTNILTNNIVGLILAFSGYRLGQWVI
jgi:CrcB protein